MLVSVEELRRYMGGFEPEPGMETEMVNILAGVQQQLETYLNRPVELVQVREVVNSDSKGNLYLSVTPVRKVISYGSTIAAPTPPEIVTIPYDMEADPLIGDEGRIVDKSYNRLSFTDFRPWGFWVPNLNTRYLIEYVGGLNGFEVENIKIAIKRVAAREFSSNYVNTAGLRTGDIDQVEIGDNRNVGWTANELKSLERYRRRIVL